MSQSTSIRCAIPTILYNRLLAKSKRDGTTITQVLITLISEHMKPEVQATTTARPAAQPRRAMTHSERLFGKEAPDDNGFPDVDEMEQRRKAVLDALE